MTLGKSFPMSGSQVLSAERRSILFKWVIHFASSEALKENRLHGVFCLQIPHLLVLQDLPTYEPEGRMAKQGL